jgi:AraC-like DNA-binding protein
LGEQLLSALSVELQQMPVTTQQAIEALVREPEGFRSAKHLATAAGVASRTLFRVLEKVGFHSPRALIDAARLVQAYALLRDPGRAIKEVAVQAGYQRTWALNTRMRAMTGRTTERVRREMEPEEFVQAIVEHIRKGRRPESGPTI